MSFQVSCAAGFLVGKLTVLVNLCLRQTHGVSRPHSRARLGRAPCLQSGSQSRWANFRVGTWKNAPAFARGKQTFCARDPPRTSSLVASVLALFAHSSNLVSCLFSFCITILHLRSRLHDVRPQAFIPGRATTIHPYSSRRIVVITLGARNYLGIGEQGRGVYYCGSHGARNWCWRCVLPEKFCKSRDDVMRFAVG